MWRPLMWVIAIAMTVGVGYVAVDAARRATTLGTFTQGIGTPDNPSREALQTAERNLIYLLGLAVGAVSGIVVAVAAGLWWLVRVRRLDAEPFHGGAPTGRPSESAD